MGYDEAPMHNANESRRRLLVFNGSPRGLESNTHAMVSPFLDGALAEGAATEYVMLAAHDIRPCTGCYDCWREPDGRCPIGDEMPVMLSKIRAADILVFAMPVYMDNVPGLLKTFMDRLMPLLSPQFEKDPQGGYRHGHRMEEVPRLAVMANCGLPDTGQFEVLRVLFRRLARHLHTELAGEIYRTQGELLRSDSLVLQPMVRSWFRLLRAAGGEMAREGRLCRETAAALERPLVPQALYASGANTYWDRAGGQNEGTE